MKKIKLNPAKLQLNKEKIANLTQEEMNNANGGIFINIDIDPNVDFLSIVKCRSHKNCIGCPKTTGPIQ
jgi:hypothetical protein